MSIKAEIVIQDSCTLFDLVDLKLLGLFFQLDLVVYTTAQVTAEITDEDQWKEILVFIENKKLEIDNDGDLQDILELSYANIGLTLVDCSVIEAAIRKKATILSSDGSLRNVSKAKGLKVHGVLWIVEQLLEMKYISQTEAVKKLNDYCLINPRAPKTEVSLLIKKICQLDN